MYFLESFTAASTASSVILTLWCSSNLGLRPLSMRIAVSTSGSSTHTGAKRLSSAGSFSTYFLYSSTVVAPITLNSPRASAGFIMFAASIAPSAAPAPTTVCSSSMKRMMLPSLLTASRTCFNLSSNSPRYLVPASKAAISRATILLSFKFSGTSPFAIL